MWSYQITILLDGLTSHLKNDASSRALVRVATLSDAGDDEAAPVVDRSSPRGADREVGGQDDGPRAGAGERRGPPAHPYGAAARAGRAAGGPAARAEARDRRAPRALPSQRSGTAWRGFAFQRPWAEGCRQRTPRNPCANLAERRIPGREDEARVRGGHQRAGALRREFSRASRPRLVSS